ncbi:PAS domain S-box protein [Methylobacterium sp. J-026]|uniref:GAF domain-containing protein n=1 Tax=Methylobacterium sp. J-026 TaxID=2836624 RepID=UPI001FBA2F4D|nr:GAF domain-containing protein [Methylobacterium sp. J-026]MCJ2133074.1 PAS domain S-box protein [Methylobacterium sp. J-026]
MRKPSDIPAAAADAHRLAALERYGILDTPPEEGFDDIVLLASQLCRAPVALISLVTADRQWFKARIGFPLCATDLNASICAHALSASDLLVIPDLTADPRTRANPLVTGDPHIRFYAGAPLRTSGAEVIGSLCVIDLVPRPEGLTAEQAANLRALARQVMSQLELKRALAGRDALLADQDGMQRARDALHRVQGAISEAEGDLGVILNTIVAGAMEATPEADGCAIELIADGELEYRAVAGTLDAFAGRRVALKGSLSGACFRSGAPMMVSDVRGDRRVNQALAARMKLRACVTVPVFRGRRTIGVLKLQSSRPGAFTEMNLQAARLFAGAASTGLTEAREAAAQRAIQTSEIRYRAIFESATDYAIVVMDLGGLITNWNAGATRILGWTPDEVIGKPADMFFTAADRAAAIPAQEMRGALTAGRGVDERWHLRKSGEHFWANGEMMALRGDAGGVIGFVKILRDRTEQRVAGERLAESEARYRSLFETIDEGFCVIEFFDGPEGPLSDYRHVEANPAYARQTGLADVVGRTIRAVAPDEADGWVALYGEVLRTGQPVHVERAFGRAGGYIEVTANRVEPVERRQVAILLNNITERVRAAEHQAILNRELSHRMKNTLAIVQAIATQTMRNAPDIEAAKEALSARLIALGKAHDILLTGQGESADLRAVVDGALQLHEDQQQRRFHLDGPPLRINEKAALSLSLMVHELATNAIKYGALSTPHGTVRIDWSITGAAGAETVRLGWRESGGPPVAAPSRKGFGSRLIERGLAGAVGGAVRLGYPVEGAVCELIAPLKGFEVPA